MNTALLPRPWSCHRPRVAGYEPQISGKVERVSRSKKYGWRATPMVDGHPMAASHHPTREEAESRLASMMEAYTSVHYESK